MRIKPRTDNIFCINADFGDTVTNAGIIIKKTLGKESGITPRWMEVFENYEAFEAHLKNPFVEPT